MCSYWVSSYIVYLVLNNLINRQSAMLSQFAIMQMVPCGHKVAQMQGTCYQITCSAAIILASIASGLTQDIERERPSETENLQCV